MKYSEFKEQISQTADKEFERCKYIEKEHNQEVNELKSEIKHLKRVNCQTPDHSHLIIGMYP